MDKNEVILKSYRFLSLLIVIIDRNDRKIGIAAKAKVEGKILVLQYKNVLCSDEKCQDIPIGFEYARYALS